MSETAKLLVTLTSPSCGGQILCEEGESLALCKYCDSFFSLYAEDGVAQVMYILTVTRKEAEKSVKSWMTYGVMAEKLTQRC